MCYLLEAVACDRQVHRARLPSPPPLPPSIRAHAGHVHRMPCYPVSVHRPGRVPARACSPALAPRPASLDCLPACPSSSPLALHARQPHQPPWTIRPARLPTRPQAPPSLAHPLCSTLLTLPICAHWQIKCLRAQHGPRYLARQPRPPPSKHSHHVLSPCARRGHGAPACRSTGMEAHR